MSFTTNLQPSQNTSTTYLQREKIQPNECPAFDTKQPDGDTTGNAEYPFIDIDPRSTLTQNGSTDRVLSMGQIELFVI